MYNAARLQQRAVKPHNYLIQLSKIGRQSRYCAFLYNGRCTADLNRKGPRSLDQPSS
ncbi:hypothetical protein QFZ45_003130 [Pseudomonas synxantha]|nr:hypothetical protein [Pseudomonas synxantha]